MIVLAIGCILQPNLTWANDLPSSAEIYGSTPSGDMSRIFLGQIFGTIDHSGLTGSGSLMPAVFKAFNTVSLGIGSVIVMFTLIVSTLNTAHQGEILGQQWSTMWIPLRAVLGVGVLIPTSAGYTLLQSFIMWGVMQGVGAANYVWQEAVSAVSPSDKETMTSRGWIMAGAYYYSLVENLASEDVLGPVQQSVQFNFRGLVSDDTSGDADADSSIQMGLSQITGSLNTAVSSWMHLFTMREGDPLLSIQKTGQEIVATVEILWIGIAIIAAAIGIASVCSAVMPIFSILQNFITWLVPLFTSLLIFLFLSGALLAYYIPLIPFIFFSLGGIGWMFGVIEAIAASPLIALGIMNPHGNDPYFGRSEPSVLLLLDIIIRPSMMIIGMMAAMVMVRVAIPFVNYGFSITGQNVYSGGISFLTSIIAMIAVYCAIIVTVVQKCFSLIHYVPDRVMRWIGGMPNAFESGASDERDIRGGFEKGMQPFGDTAGQAATSKASMKSLGSAFGAKEAMQQAQGQGGQTTQLNNDDQSAGDSSEDSGDDGSMGGGVNQSSPKETSKESVISGGNSTGVSEKE